MPFLLLLKPFNYLIFQKFGLRFGSFFFSKIFSNLNISSFLFDIYSENNDNIFLILTVISDISFSTRPRFFFFKQIYRGKTKAKILIIKKFFSRSTIFRSFLKELFLFIFNRFFILLKRMIISAERLVQNFVYISQFFLIFTLPTFVFNYLYEDIDPLLLKGLKLNFVLKLQGKKYWSKEFFFFFLLCFFSLLLNFKTID